MSGEVGGLGGLGCWGGWGFGGLGWLGAVKILHKLFQFEYRRFRYGNCNKIY